MSESSEKPPARYSANEGGKMPRKKEITKKVRRLTPTEIDFIVTCVASHHAVYEEEPGWWTNYFKQESALQGLYKHLAIIVEE